MNIDSSEPLNSCIFMAENAVLIKKSLIFKDFSFYTAIISEIQFIKTYIVISNSTMGYFEPKVCIH